ncbi:hypothetical protein JW877_07860, partial [bacterium]|nr:hypothetical protein [bacterium]
MLQGRPEMKLQSLRYVVFFCFSFIILHSLFVIRYSIASVPSTMSYQGKVTDVDGVGITDTLDIGFSLWNSDS